MEFVLDSSFVSLSKEELFDIDAGGKGLAILAGIGSVCAVVVTAVCAPPGTKLAATAKVAWGGVMLTSTAYFI